MYSANKLTILDSTLAVSTGNINKRMTIIECHEKSKKLKTQDVLLIVKCTFCTLYNTYCGWKYVLYCRNPLET
jgi:hypothetical protein